MFIRIYCQTVAAMLYLLILGIGMAHAQLSPNSYVVVSPVKELQDGIPKLWSELIDLRPNTVEQPYFLFVRNPVDEQKVQLKVEVIGPNDEVLAEGTVSPGDLESQDGVNDEPFYNVSLKAPPPPAQPKTPDAPITPMPDKSGLPPPAEEVPPGQELNFANGRFALRVRVWKLEGGQKKAIGTAQGKETASQTLEEPLYVQIADPRSYLEVNEAKLEQVGNLYNCRVNLKRRMPINQALRFLSVKGPPCPVRLRFPPQPALNAHQLRSGVYYQEIDLADPTASSTLTSRNLPILDRSKPLKFYLEVDGFPRTYVYATTIQDRTTFRQEPDPGTPRILVPGSEVPLSRIITQPDQQKRLQLITDSTRLDGQLRVQIGLPGFTLGGNGVLKKYDLPGVRKQRCWLNPAGEEGAMSLSNRVTDHTLDLQLPGLRGTFELLLQVSSEAPKAFTLLVDDTPPLLLNERIGQPILSDRTDPDSVEVLPFKREHIKGDLLEVAAEAIDFETPVVSAVFFVGQPGKDGKPPPEAPQAVGERVKEQFVNGANRSIWVSKIKIPSQPGKVDLAVALTNEAGLVSVKPYPIILIDPPTKKNGDGNGDGDQNGDQKESPTTGKVKGTVVQGGRPQPNLAVTLADADGKPQGVVTTNDKGEFTFEQVKPGVYQVTSAKPDSGVGTSGSSPVAVEAGKTAMVSVSLVRQPPQP